MRTLRTRFGTQPIRRHARVKSGDTCDLVVGLEEVHKIVSGDTDADCRSSAGWTVEDESATGIRLSKRGVKEVNLAVGELVAFRVGHEPGDWIAGIVRWARTRRGNEIEMGVYKLGADVIPATLKNTGKNTETPEFLLYLPELDPVKRQPTLIALNNHYRPNAAFNVTLGGAEMYFRATNLISSSPKFDWFEIADQIPI